MSHMKRRLVVRVPPGLFVMHASFCQRGDVGEFAPVELCRSDRIFQDFGRYLELLRRLGLPGESELLGE